MPTMNRPLQMEKEDAQRYGKPDQGFKHTLYTIIFEAETRAGRAFDLTLIGVILASVAVVIADSVQSLSDAYGAAFEVLEWAFTLVFSAEYLARLYCVQRPARYARSFFGVVDLLAVLPTYLALLLPGVHALVDVRILRLLRIFRILKMASYVAEFRALGGALASSRRKILIFLSIVLMLVLVLGTVMYVVEGPANGFTSIPVAMYWAIVTMTTVGYGDYTPHTDLGRLIAAFMMLLGWGILAVPTGIVSAEMTARRFHRLPTTRSCPQCLTEGHDLAARYCFHCSAQLPPVRLDREADSEG